MHYLHVDHDYLKQCDDNNYAEIVNKALFIHDLKNPPEPEKGSTIGGKNVLKNKDVKM